MQSDSDLELHARVFDSLTAEIAVLDVDGTICAVNEAWRQFSRENGGSHQSTGVGVNYLDICRSATGADSEFAERACLGIERVLDGSRDVFQLEYPCHSPLRNRWFLLHVSRLRGDERHAVTAHHSITERKVIEHQLVESERLAAIGQTMQGLSHEARNALQRSQGNIDLLKTKIESDRNAIRLLERVELEQRTLLGLYEEVRDYAAPISLNRESCDLVDFFGQQVSKSVSANPQMRFTIQDQHAPKHATSRIDRQSICRVFDLIIENAVASGATAIEIAFVTDELHGSPAVTVIVSDDGPGVPGDDREKAFEPFFSTKTRGTGLGLAICRRLVSAHRGHIYLGPPRCEGASVYITLPVTQSASAP